MSFFIGRVAFAQSEASHISELPTSHSTTHSTSITIQKLHDLSQFLRKKYIKLDSYIDLILLGALTDQHVLAFGGPGGSKTAVADDVLSAMREKVFSLQFSPATKEEVLKGVLNVQKMLTSATMEFNSDQSLLMHAYAVLDEIDKANPEVLAALLSILHEREALLGFTRVKGKLRSALVTSNMTLHEFLQKFRATLDEATGKAILDRVILKIFVSNRLPEAEDLYDVYCQSLEQRVHPTLSPTHIELEQLQQQLLQKIVVPAEVAKLSFQLWHRLFPILEKKQLAEKQDPLAPFPYTLSNQFTTRGAGHILNVLKANKFLNYLQKDPAFDLTEFIQSWTPADIYFSAPAMILQGPKDIASFADVFTYDPRTLKMLQDLSFEQEQFSLVEQEVLHEYDDEIIDIALPSLIHLQTLPLDLALRELAKKESEIAEKRKKPGVRKGRGIAEIAREKVLADIVLMREKIMAQKSPASIETEFDEDLKEIELSLKLDHEQLLQNKLKSAEDDRAQDLAKLVRTTNTGAVFHREEDPDMTTKLGESWRDPNGVIWGDVIKGPDGNNLKVNAKKAVMHCLKLGPGYRLAYKEEIAALREFMGFLLASAHYTPQVLPNFTETSAPFWMASFNKLTKKNHYFIPKKGKMGNIVDLDEFPSSELLEIRCVYKRPTH